MLVHLCCLSPDVSLRRDEITALANEPKCTCCILTDSQMKFPLFIKLRCLSKFLVLKLLEIEFCCNRSFKPNNPASEAPKLKQKIDWPATLDLGLMINASAPKRQWRIKTCKIILHIFLSWSGLCAGEKNSLINTRWDWDCFGGRDELSCGDNMKNTLVLSCNKMTRKRRRFLNVKRTTSLENNDLTQAATCLWNDSKEWDQSPAERREQTLINGTYTCCPIGLLMEERFTFWQK